MDKFTSLFAILLFTVSSCQDKDHSITNNEDYISPNDTLYDIIRGETVHETEDSLWFSPYEKRIPKVRKIFKKGNEYIYKAKYYSQNKEILSENNIHVIATGERIEFAPEIQDKVFYRYKNYDQDSIKLHDHKINPSLQTWTKKAIEGIIENEEEIWIHPMRHNQYKFTEVAPFPTIQFPLEIGKSWESTINIFEGWGEWNDKSVVSNYEITGRTKFKYKNRLLNCWIVYAEAIFEDRNSSLKLLFNENLGIVKMTYQNYESEELIIELIDNKST